MSLLKRENWWVWLLLWLMGGFGNVLLCSILNIYEKDAWYTKWENWFIAAICFLFPFGIMFGIFILQSTCMVAAKLNVSGKEIYFTPYTWILCMIIPIIGWILAVVMVLYLDIEILIKLSQGEAEQYIR